MITTILKFLTGNVFSTFERIYDRQLSADTDAKRLAADLAVKQLEDDQAARANAKEIRLATAGFWEMRAITFLIAAPFVLHLWAVGLDTLFRFGWAIPKWPAPMDSWQGSILLSFFGVQIATKGLDTLAFIFRKK